MTNKEAIDVIKVAKSQVEWDYPMDYAAAFDKAIEVLSTKEPKIISLEEVSKAKLFSTVYLESYFDGRTSLEAFIVDIYDQGEYVICNCRDMFYIYDKERLYKQIKNSFAKEYKDTRFRFWNALPSDEQRKEAKWE